MSTTRFQQRVYEAVSRIPRGKVATYGEVAKALGCKSARAIGQALRVNPYAPEVPCHRVIAARLTLGGFQGKTSGPALQRKLALLAGEGVCFHAGKLADPRRLFTFNT